MAGAGDAPAGIFSGVWSRLRSASSVLRCRRQASGGGDGENNEGEEDEEATVRSRLARRAAAARRLGRKLAFVSFNLEVLVFVYAFFRARRRSLSWRLPTQALPILVIPALATLIYAAFVRFTRTLDLKDKKRLQRLEEDKQQSDGEPRNLDQNDQNDVQSCDGVDNASKSLVSTDSEPPTPKLRKHRHSSIKQKDDGEADITWGHSKDFQPAPPSGGLRLRRPSSTKTYTTNNSATETTEENTQKTPSVSTHSDQHIYHVPANTPEELSAGDGEEAGFDGSWDVVTGTPSSSSMEYLMISPVVPHNSFCDRDDSRRSSEHAASYLSTAFFQDLLVKVHEEQSLPLPEKLEFSPAFVEEAAASTPDEFVSHCSLNDLSSVILSHPVPSASETLKELPADGVIEKESLEPQSSAATQVCSFTSEENSTSCAVDDKELLNTSDVATYPLPPICSDAAIVNIDTVNPRWSLLLELYGNRFEETESPMFHVPEESTSPLILEEVLPSSPSVNSIECSLGTTELSSCSKGTEKMEVAGSVSSIDDNSELSFLASPELVVEGSEDATEKELCELNTKEENAILINKEEDEALQDPLLVSSTSEQCLEDAKVREVPEIINFVTASPELMNPPSPEVLAEDDEEFKEDKTSDLLHLPEQNDTPFNFEKEAVLDSPVADDTAEHLLVTPLCSEEVEITEVHDVVKEGVFESAGEDAFNHGKLVIAPSDDDGTTQSLTSDSMPVQFIPNTDIDEALEGGQAAFSEPLHQSTRCSEGMFLSSVDINNDEVYSSNSNSDANVVEDEAPFAGLPKFEDEMAITSLNTPIFLDEIKSAAIVDSDAVSPKLSLQPELHSGGVEANESSEFQVPGEIRTPFNLEEEEEEEVMVSPLAVNTGSLLKQLEFICQSVGTPEFSVSNQESEEVEVAGSVSFVKDSPELSFLSSPELVTDVGEDAREKGTEEINTKEENEMLINLEDEALHGELVVSSTDQCLETSEFPLSSQGAKTMKGPEVAAVSPEFNYPAFSELLTEGDGDLKEDGTSELHLREQKGLPIDLEDPFLDHLIVVDTAEDTLVTSELLVCSEEVKMTEIHGVLSESEDEGAFDHQKLVLTSPDDDSAAQNLISISDASVKEASRAGQEAPSEPPHEGTFLSSGVISHDEVKVEAPFAGHEGFSMSEDEMALAPLESPILLDAVASAESLTGNSGSSLSIPDINQIQYLHDNEQPPSETLPEVTSLLEGSHTSSDEGINSEIFSLYSRSSSCVSEINMLETLRGGATSESPREAEFILDTNVTETLNAAEEATAGSLHEDSLNILGTFVAPVVINDMRESDKHLDLSSSSFAPVVDVFESLQTGHQDFSELQYEDDFTVQETPVFLEEVKVAENDFTETIGDTHQDSEGTSVVALLDEDSTLQRAYMSPEGVKNSLADDCASDLPHHTAESRFFSGNLSPESQDPLSFEEILEVYPDEGSNAENDLGTPNSPLCSTEVNLAESRGMVDQEANAEDLVNNSGSVHIPDVIMADSLQGADIVSSEILYDERNPVTFPNMDSTESNTDDPVTAEFILETDMIETLNAAEEATAGSFHEDSSKILGTFVALDVINDMTESDKHLDLSSSRATDKSVENTQKTPSISAYLDQHVYYVPLSTEDDEEFQEDETSDLDLSEQNDIPFNFEKEPILNSLVADTAEHLLVTPLYVPISTEEDEEFKDDKTSDLLHLSEQNDIPFFFEKEPILDSLVADTAKHLMVTPLYSEEEVEITEVHDVVKEATLEPQEDPLSSEEILEVYPHEGSNAGNDLPTANSSLRRSAEVTLAEPWAIDQEGAQQHDEAMLGIEDNSGSPDIPDDVITADVLRGASSEILYDGMSSFEGTLLSLDGHDNAEEDSPNNNSGSSVHTAQINTTSPFGLQEGSFKPEDEHAVNSTPPYEADTTEETAYSSVFAKDNKEPKEEDGESKDMKEDVQDLDDGHENNPINTFEVDEITAALAPKLSVELYINDALAPVATISSSNGSSTVSELADGQYTGSVDDDSETLGAPLPSSVDTE